VIQSLRKTTINPADLALLLDSKGYYVDEDTGEVITKSPHHDEDPPSDLLIILAAVGTLTIGPDFHNDLSFFITNWRSFHSIEEYCEDFPADQQCKNYDV